MRSRIATSGLVTTAVVMLFPAPEAVAQDSPFVTPGMPPLRRLEAGQTDRFTNDFNPAIGAVIDAIGDWSDPDAGEDGFDIDLRTLELGVNGRIDPNWWGYAVLVGSEEFEVEEAAAHYTGFDSNTTLRFGKFFADFGKQMQVHVHDLPYPNRPGVLAEYLGDELPGVGAQIDHWWETGDTSALRVSFGVFSELGGEHGHGEEEEGPELALADRRDLGDMALTARVTQFMDVGANAVFQWGASARHFGDFSFEDETNGLSAVGLSNTVYGVDLTLGIDDDSGLSGWTFGGEYLVASGDIGAEVVNPTTLAVFDDDVAGYYAWGERRFDRFNSAGVLLGSYEHPEEGTPTEDELTAYYTRNMSEFARVRLFATLNDSEEDGDTTTVGVQLTGYFGPHSHGVNW
ncbi:hypothetical protein Pla163_31400 [Planctomycetes bacterium Pla163]|jgi:hypothetical protein|uniref:Porin domain-containing protein n=1 Tax=Rohdeia mirabilis TaxID=2528008 RepID=A0A518D3E1_9BACT|nr:hypothetical protein Pla163_31400 [Planctomycetes bacterium Pla163]